ncbi:Electron transfer flavoprotein subunit beta [Methylocella tundrae]|uniref:Electron transfer flavoprotein subunit beta n=1 Tax=Methylocella tundrae TaxID=227605 RepID=A0A8B6M7Z0_METTU|nr:electron transfer flavoprotein subunit beta [Methylocella tundrae]VTZ27581.1 Electron transfer flavoprotein subunit beta [Methylocella tundrae]VTZ51139.1 Electron transfer flavoprotein subunit beta [Methylocella tundrae]
MNVVVFLAGIADPKWPLSAVSTDVVKARADNHVALSPFDEAALETAMKIRDGWPGTRLTVAMIGGPESEILLRKVAAYRVDRVARIDARTLSPWDSRALAARLAATLAELDAGADLILIGREFGDCDAGGLPPCLAATLGWPFFGLTQHAEWDGECLSLLREQGSIEEKASVTGPLVASVTNDRRNRLRHPLMKNVMEAKRMNIVTVTPPKVGASRVSLAEICGIAAATREVACRVLDGPLDAQVAELAAFLGPWSARP